MQFFKLLGARKNSENLKNFLVLKIHQVLVIFEKKKNGYSHDTLQYHET